MKPELKSLIIELFTIVTVFIATWLAAFWLTGRHHILHPALEIELHDTYFVLSWKTIVAEPFLMFVTIIYLVKEGLHGYKRRIQNSILIAGNFIFIAQLSRLFAVAGILADGEWGVPSSGSALPNEKPLLPYLNLFYKIEQTMFVTLIIFMLILVVSAILTGKNWKSEPYEPKV